MKTYRFFALALLAGLFTASCTKNAELDVISNPTLTKASFEAVVDGSVKLSLDGLTPSWQNGDQICIYQYGYYKRIITETDTTNVYRDNTKNIFTTTGGTTFTGSIANYHLKESTGGSNCFCAIYPTSVVTSYAMATTTTGLTVSPSQTGLLSDIGKHLTFRGRLVEAMDSTVRYQDNELTFLLPISMKCCTPVLKFNVPEALDVKKILISASNTTTENLGIAGDYTSRLDNEKKNWKAPKVDTISIYRNGNVISGDVYVVLAPDTNLGNFDIFSSATTLCFALTKSNGWTANLKVNITETAKVGKIKNLKSFPTSVTWQKPVSPGLASISCESTDEATKSPYKKILLTAENSSSVIKYSSCEYTGDNAVIATLAAPTTVYSDGIATDDGKNAYPANFSKIQIETENCSPYTCKAITWKTNSKIGFGYYVLNNEPTTAVENVTTIPADGAYLYGLNLLLNILGNKYNRPHIKSAGFYLYKPTDTYASGTLSFIAPENGKAAMYFNQAISSSSKKIIVSKGTTVVSEESGIAAGNYKSKEFSVSAGDVISVKATGQLALYSMTFLWVPSTDN